MNSLTAKTWFTVAVALGILPSLMGWLVSYGWSVGFLRLGILAAALLCLSIGFVKTRASLSTRSLMVLLAVWLAFVIGGYFVGAGVVLPLWNPEWLPPFMTGTYAAQQAAIGITIWMAAAITLGRSFSIWGRRDG